MSELGLVRGSLRFAEIGSTAAAPAVVGAEVTPISGLLIFAPEESLFFANADTVRVQITNRLAAAAAAGTEPVKRVLLDLELTNEIDVPSADVLGELHEDLAASGVQLLLARVRPAVRDLLDRSGITAKIDADHIYGRVLEGTLFHLGADGTQPEAFLGLSGDALKRLLQVVDEMLPQADDSRRAQLEALATQLRRAIEQAERG